MQTQRRRDTSCEIALRSHIHKLGLRYRVDARPLKAWRRRADLVFASAKVAVFVDGCFWHGCPSHGTLPKANSEWWEAKLARNQARDAETNATLAAAGWAVIRVWEHEDPVTAAQKVASLVRARIGASRD